MSTDSAVAESQELRYAGLPRRIVAHVLDVIVLIVAMLLLEFIGSGNRHVEILVTPIQGALMFLYTLYFHANIGQTLGKKWMKIVVVSREGKRIGFNESFRRNAVLLLMSLPWPIATMIALSRISPNLYADAVPHARMALEISLRPAWYDPVQLVMFALLAVDLIAMIASKQHRSLHDRIGGTCVVRTGATDPNRV